jgi:ABC-2 type transport system ATP-binding protein
MGLVGWIKERQRRCSGNSGALRGGIPEQRRRKAPWSGLQELRAPSALCLSGLGGATYNPSIMAIIEIRKLSKSYRVYQKQEGLLASVRSLFHREYREVRAVREIDLTVEQGELVAFLGPNGAGKTTTLKLLSGVISPTAGEATVMGHVPWKRANAYRRRFALVMGQKNQLWWDLPAQESFRLHQQIYRIEISEFERTLDELTALLGVKKLLNQPVRELSLGERMKMELIAALLHSPDVLFLDEPTIGLDVIAQHNIQQFLKFYQQKRQITTLLTSHYMKDVTALCQRVVIIAGGQIMYNGSLSGIIDQFSRHKIVTLQFAEDQGIERLERFGEVINVELPKAQLCIERAQVPKVLAPILADYAVEDIIVEDPPLEDVIAEVFAQADAASEAEQEEEVRTA